MKDVLIIGAGPSGAVAAALLVDKGHRVLVLEKQKFPRFSVGESLLAQTLGLIDEAGLLEPVLGAGFQFKNGAAFVRRDEYSEYNFAHKVAPGYGYTFQVQRAQFDKILIDTAERRGAKVLYEVEITAAEFPGGKPRITARSKDGSTSVYTPDFVLDASGFGRTLPRLLGLEQPSDFPLRTALFTQVYDRIPSGAFDRQKIRATIHPERPDVWYWLIPFSDGRVSIGVVAPDEFLKRYSGSHEERLWALHREDRQLAELLKDARPANPVGELKGYAANVKAMWGPGFALLGNAGEFLDPIFSSGVTIALKSAHLAAGVLDRQLRGERPDWDAEFEVPLRYGVDTFRAFVTTWYDGRLQDIFFFHQPQQPDRIHRSICSVLAGYAWDKNNPYTGEHALRRLNALAHRCRDKLPVDAGLIA